MRLREALLLAVVVAFAASACSRLTFIRPSAKPGKYEQVAPTYEFKDSPEYTRRTQAREHLGLAEDRLRSGQLDQAESEARLALKSDSASAGAYTVLALVEDRRGNATAAGAHYAKAAELAPGQGAMLNNYGAWLCGNGRAAESLAFFDKALADPAYRERAGALANAGACALRAGQTGRVERDLRAALEIDPDNQVALAAMAEYQYGAGNYFDARAFSQRRLAAAPATAAALLLASQIEDKLGDKVASARYVQRMRSEFPQAGTTPGESSQP